jgi:hypothetical protein
MSDDNIHTSASALVIAAAEKSGLLQEVADLLQFAKQHSPPFGCAVCEFH